MQWDVRQAAQYHALLKNKMELLTAMPELGRARDELRHGYRSFQIARHLIFYRKAEQGIEIVRVLHVSMQAQLQFWMRP